MHCENCNEPLRERWCEDCWVEWHAYNNPSVLDAAVWPAAEPSDEPPAAENEIDAWKEQNAEQKKKIEALEKQLDTAKGHLNDICSLIDMRPVNFDTEIDAWLEEMKREEDLRLEGEESEEFEEFESSDGEVAVVTEYQQVQAVTAEEPAAEPEPGKALKG